MANQPKASWPRRPDGTADWEAVFEDPAMGFISLVSRAHSLEMVEKTAIVIIQKLFTRRNDIDLCKQNIHRLRKIIADHKNSLDRAHEEVAVLMRGIKNERIELARIFAERKAAGAAIDRRGGLFWKATGLFKPKVLIPVGAVFISILVALFYFVLQPDSSATNNYAADFGKTKAANSSKTEPSSGTYDPTAAPSDAAVKPDPIPIWLKTVRWPLVPLAGNPPAKFYSVILYVDGDKIRYAVCGRIVSVMDSIFLAFNKSLPQNREPRIDELTEAEDQVKIMLNKMLGGNMIQNAKVARYGTAGFKAASLPPFCKSPIPQ